MTTAHFLRRVAGAALWLAALAPAYAAEPAPTVRFTVIPRYNPLLMVQSYQPIMDYLSARTPYHFELKLARDYAEAVRLLADREVDLASLGGVTFIKAYRTFGAVPLVRPRNAAGQAHYRSVVIVRADSDIRSLEDLRGRSFAFGSHHSTSGNLVPRTYLFRHGIGLDDLGWYKNLGKHDSVAKAVLKGNVDAGAVKDVIAERYREHGLRFLAESDPIPAVPIVAHPETPEGVRRAVTRALLALDPVDAEQQRMMASWDPEFRHGFVPATLEDYRPIVEMLDAVGNGCGEGCHR
ncbi:MAG: phosphate/phosphite/phosphonate ABC transporter substrate-binding protein [Deferrisomatales bacterium]|nr:phosphate/phosphite/phosphonate ABC transporter substrate-binding protein [Deferrisomatales bacterium]